MQFQHRHPASPLNIPFPPPHPLFHHHREVPLASSNRRPRNNITRRHRPIKLKQQPRVRRLVRPRETDQLPRRLDPARPAGDLDLRAAQVKLRPAHTPRGMQRNVLHAEQVLAVLDALGDLHAYLFLACPPTVSAPTTTKEWWWGKRTSARPSNTPGPQPHRRILKDLEPHRALAVEGRGRLASGHFGEVE